LRGDEPTNPDGFLRANVLTPPALGDTPAAAATAADYSLA